MGNTTSSGILLFRKNKEIEFFLVYPGGLYTKSEYKRAWSIPKGHVEKKDTSLLDTALRECTEELGIDLKLDTSKLIDLGKIQQNEKKTVYCYAYNLDLGDDFIVKSATCMVEYPRKSGKLIEIPEISKGMYFTYNQLEKIIVKKQIKFIERLLEKLNSK